MSMEILIKIEAPDLTASLNNLAAAFGNRVVAATAPTPATTRSKKQEATPKAEPTEVKAETITPPATAPDPLTTEEPPKEEPPKEEVIYTLEQVREKLAALSRDGKQAQVKALITKTGAAKLSEIPPEKYAELMKEAEAL